MVSPTIRRAFVEDRIMTSVVANQNGTSHHYLQQFLSRKPLMERRRSENDATPMTALRDNLQKEIIPHSSESLLLDREVKI